MTPTFIVQGNENSVYSHKRIVSNLFVEYWDFPSVWGHLYPYQGVGLTPTLAVGATNPGGRAQQYAFEVATDPGMANVVAASGWLGSMTWSVPEGILRPGAQYYWRAHLIDDVHGHLGQSTYRVTPTYAFTTNQVPLPAAWTESA